MNMQVALSALRQVLIFVGGILVGKGLIDQAMLETLVPAIITIVASGWGLYAKYKDQAKIADK
jgi:hypothetical protein